MINLERKSSKMPEKTAPKERDGHAAVNSNKESLKPGASAPAAGPANKVAATGESQQESARARVEWNLAHGGGPGAKPKEGERKKRGGAKKGDAKKGEGKKEDENQGNRGSDKVRPLDRGSFATTANDKRFGAKSRFGRRFPCWA